MNRKLLWNRNLMILSTAMVVLAVSSILVYRFFAQTPEAEFSLKAAIIDQLSIEFPNSNYSEVGTVATMLKKAGFNVSYYGSQNVSVAFYKNLVANNFGIIVLRVHAALREGESTVDFFTSEEFNVSRYDSELANGLLTVGHYSLKQGKFYFAIAPKFIENLEGHFPKSIVLAMGCNTLNAPNPEMADAFMRKGAKAYIGWTGLVSPWHTDNETIRLLHRFLTGNKTISQSIATLAPDPVYGSRMTSYPSAASNLSLHDLTTKKTYMMRQEGSENSNLSFHSASQPQPTIAGITSPFYQAKLSCQLLQPSRDDHVQLVAKCIA